MADVVEVQFQRILPPSQGAIAALAITTAVTIVDLTTLPSGLGATGGTIQPDQTNVVGKYVRVYADGGTIYHAYGNNANALALINANSVSAVAANGTLTLTGNECFPIPVGTFSDEIVVSASNGANTGMSSPQQQIPRGGLAVSRYLALIMQTGTATARFYQSSP